MVLPCVPATATPRRPAITAARAAARGSTRRPRSRAATQLGLSPRIARGDDDGVGVADVVRRRGRRRPARRAPAAPAASGVLGVAARDRARRGRAGSGRCRSCRRRRCRRSAPAELGQRGIGPVTGARRRRSRGSGRLEHHAAASALVGVAVPRRRAAAPRHRRQPRPGRRSSGTHGAPRSTPAVSSASATSRPPPASTVGARVEPLLAVADRQRHVDRRQADGRELGAGHRARPAQRQVGGGVGQVHVVEVGHDDVRRAAPRAAARRDASVFCGARGRAAPGRRRPQRGRGAARRRR